MSYSIITTPRFSKDIKKFVKKYSSIKSDFSKLIEELEENPTTGTSLGNQCYKIRLAISSKGKDKSGGARVITHLLIKDETVFLLSIYDKFEKENILDSELKELLNQVTDL